MTSSFECVIAGLGIVYGWIFYEFLQELGRWRRRDIRISLTFGEFPTLNIESRVCHGQTERELQ